MAEDDVLRIVSAGMIVVGIVLAIWSAVVYRGWFLGAHPWAIATRRRLYWHAMRHGIPGTRLQPAVIPYALGFALLGVASWMIADDQRTLGGALGAIALIAMLVSGVIAWRRPIWLLAPWHRTEIERERQGLPPEIPPPPEGPSMTMTRRERRIGFVLVGVSLIGAWVLDLAPAVYIGLAPVLGFLAVAEIRDR